MKTEYFDLRNPKGFWERFVAWILIETSPDREGRFIPVSSTCGFAAFVTLSFVASLLGVLAAGLFGWFATQAIPQSPSFILTMMATMFFIGVKISESQRRPWAVRVWPKVETVLVFFLTALVFPFAYLNRKNLNRKTRMEAGLSTNSDKAISAVEDFFARRCRPMKVILDDEAFTRVIRPLYSEWSNASLTNFQKFVVQEFASRGAEGAVPEHPLILAHPDFIKSRAQRLIELGYGTMPGVREAADGDFGKASTSYSVSKTEFPDGTPLDPNSVQIYDYFNSFVTVGITCGPLLISDHSSIDKDHVVLLGKFRGEGTITSFVAMWDEYPMPERAPM